MGHCWDRSPSDATPHLAGDLGCNAMIPSISPSLHPMKFSHSPQCKKISRRWLLKSLSVAPLAFRPSSIFPVCAAESASSALGNFSEADPRLLPHYPMPSPLADILRLVQPGSDEYPLEKYAEEIESTLEVWGAELRKRVNTTVTISPPVDAQIEASDLSAQKSTPLRSGFGVETLKFAFPALRKYSREQFSKDLTTWLGLSTSVEAAEFEIFNIEQLKKDPLSVRIQVRYDIVSTVANRKREERVGAWQMEWLQDEHQTWKAQSWRFAGETVCRVEGRAFEDITSRSFGGIESFRSQLLHGADYWRTVIDGAVAVDVYGNHGLAAGDFDGDGFDDLYICQPAGLPNRLYRNRGDGSFEDVTEKAGVGVLDSTSCALFADFLNRGRQDLLVVCGTGPLLFLNNGDGTFSLRPDAFKFSRSPQGSFTHAAIADYDNDGRLDIYFCLYMYYLGLEQYNYPVPYYDARNGPPNCLFRNQGDGTFVEATESSGLNINNNRYSFACAWGDSNGNGIPDLFVANDFGSSQLYRNHGDGTFRDVSGEAHIESVGAGMGCCWADFDNDGHQDIYVPSMWEAAGQRVSSQPQFHQGAPARIRELYQRHARGNALYRNRGDGTFENAGNTTGVEMGRWSWSSDFWDWDHDGYSDLYVTNGYLTGPKHDELAGFFWRQIVAKSPEDATPLTAYERGWNAINELIRADHTWHGHARNVAFTNNQDGTFTEASGALLLDFQEDARAFVLADLDHDGRLEVIVKNRNAPQIRALHNVLTSIGESISFRLRGTRSNRDAIGASITVTAGNLRQTKYLQAGSGFISQHTKELFFGIGRHTGGVKAEVAWPSGLKQTFVGLPTGNRISLEEGIAEFTAIPFTKKTGLPKAPPSLAEESLPLNVETWLVQPLKAPDFKLLDLDGSEHTLASLAGKSKLITFWSMASDQSKRQLSELQARAPAISTSGLKTIAINLDDPSKQANARSIASHYHSVGAMLFATEEVAGIYNLLYRHLFDRQRDMPIPLSLLLDSNGMIVKVYQGFVESSRCESDSGSIPDSPEKRMRYALPFPGRLVRDVFERNDFTLGVAFYQHGFFDQASASFEQVIAAKPDNANAYYNLGTLNLRRNQPNDAKRYLQKTVELKPEFAEAWNNLGMLAAQEGDADAAIRDFQRSVEIRPNYSTAYMNLGNLYRRLKAVDKASDALTKALALRPDDPEVQYSIGMLFAQQDKLADAGEHLERALALRPDYPEALNNLGVLFVRQRNYAKAEEEFREGIRRAPAFDQSYLNLARLYALQNEKEKAREVVEELLRLQPDNAKARDAMSVLQSAP